MIWHALTVSPNRELHVAEKLQRHIISTLVPIEWKWRKTTAKGQPQKFRKPVAPGYVFAGFISRPDWYDIRLIDGLRGVVHIDGRPAVLTTSDVLAIEHMDQKEPASPPDHSWKRGDKVRLRVGALAQLDAVIQKISGGDIVLIASLLGGEKEIRMKVGDMPERSLAAVP